MLKFTSRGGGPLAFHRPRWIAAGPALLTLIAILATPLVALADHPPPTAAITPGNDRRPLRSREAVGVDPRNASASPGGSGSWWFGTAGIALALAAVGWASLAARKFRTTGGPGLTGDRLQVIGRTYLSPKHSVYLLRAGDRVLIVGTGPQGAPSLLGEMPPPSPSKADRSQAAPRHMDVRLGDDA